MHDAQAQINAHLCVHSCSHDIDFKSLCFGPCTRNQDRMMLTFCDLNCWCLRKCRAMTFMLPSTELS